MAVVGIELSDAARMVAPLIGSGVGAYLGVMAANQKGLRALEALVFAASMVLTQTKQLQDAAPRGRQEYEMALALNNSSLVSSLLRHITVSDLPKDVPIRFLATFEALSNNLHAMIERGFKGEATEAEMDSFLRKTVRTIDSQLPYLQKEQAHYRRNIVLRWFRPTPWRKQIPNLVDAHSE